MDFLGKLGGGGNGLTDGFLGALLAGLMEKKQGGGDAWNTGGYGKAQGGGRGAKAAPYAGQNQESSWESWQPQTKWEKKQARLELQAQAELADQLRTAQDLQEGEADMFLMMNDIEAHAQQKFKAMDPKLQYIAAQGSLDNAFDKTGVLVGRMNHLERTSWNLPGKKKRGHLAQYLPRGEWSQFGATGGQELSPEDADTFLMVNGIEEHAAAQFKSMPPSIQFLCQQTSMEGARDKTAVLIGRMKKAGQGGGGGGGARGGGDPNVAAMYIMCAELGPGEAQTFLLNNDIADHAQQQFLGLDPKLQYLVTRKPLDDAKDKTAVVISRMNKLAKAQPGDWVCPQCEDLQFSKNTACRQCGAGRP